MKKGTVLLILVFLLAGCGNTGDGSNMYKTEEEGNRTGVEIAKLEDVILLGNNEKEGSFNEVVVQMRDKSQSFNWQTSNNATYYPTVEKLDINDDGTNEIVIITTRYTGSDINVQDLHVLKSQDLTELHIEDPLTYTNQNTKSTIKKSDGIVNIHIQANSQQVVEKIFKEEDAGLWFDEVSYINHIKYEIEDNKITATLLGAVSPSLVVATVKIEYDQDLNAADLVITEVNN